NETASVSLPSSRALSLIYPGASASGATAGLPSLKGRPEGQTALTCRTSIDLRHRLAERHGACISRLRSGLQRMEPCTLDIPEAPLQPVTAIEAGPAGKLHGKLDGADGMLGNQGAPDHHLIDRFRRWSVPRYGLQHPAVRKLRSAE